MVKFRQWNLDYRVDNDGSVYASATNESIPYWVRVGETLSDLRARTDKAAKDFIVAYETALSQIKKHPVEIY